MNDMTELPEELDLKLILQTLMALKKGDFSARMPSDWTGVSGKIADTLNDIIETKQKMVETVTDVSRVVGREGHLTQRADLPGVVGGWATIISSVSSREPGMELSTSLRPITSKNVSTMMPNRAAAHSRPHTVSRIFFIAPSFLHPQTTTRPHCG